MQRILTGIQSTGIPHLGNILGAICPAIELTKKNSTPAFFFIADLHALTTERNPIHLRKFTYATAAAWLACGLDPQKNFLYRQSRIPEVCELAWYLNCLTPYPMLANAHAFKEKSLHLASVSAGLFTYPVLMAADILLYHTTHVPVGKDQQQHLEISRDIAQQFNRQFQAIFTLPQAIISKKVAIIPGTDGRKMSKSYQNTLNIFATENEITRAVMRIATGNTPLASPKDPDKCVVFRIYQRIAPQDDINRMRQRYQTGGYGYHAAKKELLGSIIDIFSLQRKTFNQYMKYPEELEKQLQEGEKKAREVAYSTLVQVREILGLASLKKV